MRFTVQFKAPAGLKVIAALLTPALVDAMHEAQAVLESSAKRNVPVRTGNLRRAIGSEDPVVTGAKIVGIVGARIAEAKYAAFVERGTGVYHEPDAHGPWTVVPKNAKALAWRSGAVMLNEKGKKLYMNEAGNYTTTKHDAAMVFARKVTIQGMKARPYLAPSVEQNREKIQSIFRSKIQQAIKQAGELK